jgi:hypothetical protein|tara:strand:+ start:434 stop:583 length:150 start_codon:yes stop_codon:yes gene_type:complete
MDGNEINYWEWFAGLYGICLILLYILNRSYSKLINDDIDSENEVEKNDN